MARRSLRGSAFVDMRILIPRQLSSLPSLAIVFVSENREIEERIAAACARIYRVSSQETPRNSLHQILGEFELLKTAEDT